MPNLALVLSNLVEFLTRPAYLVYIDLFVIFGWTFLAYACLYLVIYLWVEEYKEPLAKKDWEWKMLAIDIPKENIQTPKAVEQMFAHLAGALETPNIAMKFWRGHKQRSFSFEVVSIEGYIQFLIRTEAELQDMVESAVQAQYPDAEIIEVEDYVDNVPDRYPNDTHDIWVADFGLTQKDIYPIRTYEEFEHNAAEDEPFKDPMSAFLESFSKIKEGEQLWFQIIAKPKPDDWKERGIKEVKDLIGEKRESSGGSIFGVIPDMIYSFLESLFDEILGRREMESESRSTSSDDGPPNKMMYLTPGQKRMVENIEDKISKIGFHCKVRGVYVAEKDVFRAHRGMQALIGAVNQFNVPSENSLKPLYTTDVSYWFTDMREKHRKNLMMYGYKNRKRKKGSNAYYLNIEELATLWHFPMSYVKTPMVQKSFERKAEPPPELPIENMDTSLSEDLFFDGEEVEEENDGEQTDEEQQNENREGYSPDQKFG